MKLFWLLALLITKASCQSCAMSPNYIKGFASIYEHTSNFDVTYASAIDTDYKGSVFVCGTGDSDPSGTQTARDSQAFVFKTDYAGILVW